MVSTEASERKIDVHPMGLHARSPRRGDLPTGPRIPFAPLHDSMIMGILFVCSCPMPW